MTTHLSAALWAGRGAPPATVSVAGSVRIRLATSRDRGAVRRIECACFGRARFLFGLWPRVGKHAVSTWLAEDNGNPAGYIIAYQHDLDGRPAPYVGGVAVLPQFRQRGIGIALMSVVLADQGSVWLHVRASNAAAVAMYQKLGMRERRRMPGFYTNGEDAIVMVTCESSV